MEDGYWEGLEASRVVAQRANAELWQALEDAFMGRQSRIKLEWSKWSKDMAKSKRKGKRC